MVAVTAVMLIAFTTLNAMNLLHPVNALYHDKVSSGNTDISGNNYSVNKSEKSVKYTEYKVPDIDTSFKAYMDYKTITDKKSLQWELQQEAHTDEFGLRKVGELYCVAVGTYYAQQCGEALTVTLDDGTEFEVVVSDIKDNKHTDKKNMYTPLKNGNGNLLEFIVDTDFLSDEIKKLGNVSSLGMDGNVKSVKGKLNDSN